MISATCSIIGIDVACDARNVGVALGQASGTSVQIQAVAQGRSWEQLTDIILSWVEGSTLLAIDAPLGWPSPLGTALADHRAGDAIAGFPDHLFRRRTDEFVAEVLGKRPLDVGADRIARTAHKALDLLQTLSHKLEQSISIAWKPSPRGVHAIEVYPAGTLKALGLQSSGYKGHSRIGLRQALVKSLSNIVEMAVDSKQLATRSDHVLDACLCVIAGADFLRGDALPPPDLETAVKEGWIWVRPPLLRETSNDTPKEQPI